MDRLRNTTPETGGGAPPRPMVMDPNGIVPVNRTQPVANDGYEVQRLMERRLGTMPPVNFLAGQARAVAPPERVVSIAQGPGVSAQARQKAAFSQLLNHQGLLGWMARRVMRERG